jgi:hypothetical protein
MMSHIPGIVGIHELKDSLRVIANARLPIGSDKRNRPSLFPFGAATGRNRHSKSLFNAHAGMRSFMVFPPDKIGAYIDWRTQEIGLAADLSGDPALIDAYLSGDIYHALARMCGLTDDENAVSWGKQNPAVRQQMKKIQLGINYGMGVASLARGINPAPADQGRDHHRQADLSTSSGNGDPRWWSRQCWSAASRAYFVDVAHLHEPEPARIVELPNAGRWRGHAAAGDYAAVRCRPRPLDAGP